MNPLKWCIFFNLFIIVTCVFPEFEIRQGIVRGKYVNTINNQRIFSAFTGIPYAKPPVGKLRFKAPQPAEKWDGILNATAPHNICPQKIGGQVVGDEDCLYLNVYTPKLTKLDETLFPVMIYIYGSSFRGGSANYDLHGPNYFLNKDIVLIVFNYRLGPLGFFSTGSEPAPGNAGLKDQHLAIKWIKSNIKQFGGNPDNITLFGHSSGAVSAHMHLLSPLSKDLFSGVILQSGTAFSPWAIDFTKQVERNSRALARHLHCPTEVSLITINCLENVTATDLINGIDEVLGKWYFDPSIPFMPVIEANVSGSFLSQPPAEILASGKIPKIPVIIGYNSEDGAFKAAGIFEHQKFLKEFQKNFDVIAPLSFGYNNVAGNLNDLTNKIKKYYFGSEAITNNSRSKAIQMYTDRLFMIPANIAAEMHTENKQSVYYYEFGYRGSSSYSDFYGSRVKHNYGVCHGDELIYLFQDRESFPVSLLNGNDSRMMETMINLWTNFAYYGNPTPNSKKWSPVKRKNLNVLLIKDGINLTMNNPNNKKKLDFWDRLTTEPDFTTRKYLELKMLPSFQNCQQCSYGVILGFIIFLLMV